MKLAPPAPPIASPPMTIRFPLKLVRDEVYPCMAIVFDADGQEVVPLLGSERYYAVWAELLRRAGDVDGVIETK